MSSRSTSFAVLFVSLSLFGCSSSAAIVVPPRAPAAGSTLITIETFNVHDDIARDRATLDAVGMPDADIVCIQEATAGWERALRDRYAQKYPHMVFRSDERSGGLAVLSRFPLAERAFIEISDWHPAMLVDADTPAGRLQVLDVHLRATFDGDHDWISNSLDVDGDHLREVELFTSRMQVRVPAVVIGDFNEGARGPAVRWLEEERGFENVLPLFRPGQVTWRGRALASGMSMEIDHVLHTRALRALDAWVAPQGTSDHLPVVARFEVTRPWGEDPR